MGSQGYIRPHEQKLELIQRLFDSVLIALSHYFVVSTIHPGHWSVFYVLATLFSVFVFYIFGEMGHLYRPWRASTWAPEAKKVMATWTLTFMAMLFLGFVFKMTSYYSRVTTFAWFLVAPTALIALRIALRQVLRQLREHGRNTRTVAVVGATKAGNDLLLRVLGTPGCGMRILGVFDDRKSDRVHELPMGVGINGSLDDLVELAKSGGVDVVYVALPLRAESRINELVQKLADTTASVYVVADFFVFDLLNAQWSDVEGLPVVSVFESPFFGVDGWLKRAQDIVLGFMILLLISFPMALIALGVKLTSKGPIFFKQHRYGLNGQKIKVLKFRTMTVCEDGDDLKQATKNDSRITPFGAFLRKTSLDELPQFLQVLTGEMSIVGPRPHAVAHNEEYRRIIHGYMLRHKVKPGITGWAQVNGWRGETDTLEKMVRRVEHDLEYIRKWSLLLDLKIILMTVLTGFASRNAY